MNKTKTSSAVNSSGLNNTKYVNVSPREIPTWQAVEMCFLAIPLSGSFAIIGSSGKGESELALMPVECDLCKMRLDGCLMGMPGAHRELKYSEVDNSSRIFESHATVYGTNAGTAGTLSWISWHESSQESNSAKPSRGTPTASPEAG